MQVELMLDVYVESTPAFELPMIIALLAVLFVLISMLCCLRDAGDEYVYKFEEEPELRSWRVEKGQRSIVIQAFSPAEAMNVVCDMWNTDIFDMSVTEVD